MKIPDILTRIHWYTHSSPQESLRLEFQAREQALAYARELEQIAAELQDIADEIRRIV